MRSLVFASVLLAAPFAHAAADQKVRCANAHEQAQRARNEGHFLASREQLLTCSDEACPAVLRTECFQWLGEVERATPTVVVVADVGGAETADVTVAIDGKPVLEHLDGKAIPVDPGPHTFRFVHEGHAPIEQKVLVREGEKRRPVSVSFKTSAPPKAPERPSPPLSVPTATWVLGGFGVIALGVSVPLYLSAYSQKSSLDADPCAPAGTCDPERANAVKRRFVFGDVAATVGVVALGGAAIVWLTAPSAPVAAGLAPTSGGFAGTIRLAF